MYTTTEQALALRALATQLSRLADEVEAGHAEYKEGDFDYEARRGFAAVPEGPVTRRRPLFDGEVHLRADIKFARAPERLWAIEEMQP